MPKRTDISKILIIGPGPHDSHYLFKDFVKMMEAWKR
jgi:hypothetical protein